MFSGLGAWLSSVLPKFDVGTDRVPHDMFAMIHKDEMIVPAYDANRIRAGKGGGAPHVTNNHFAISGPVTRDTQTQIAHAVSIGMVRGQRRNG